MIKIYTAQFGEHDSQLFSFTDEKVRDQFLLKLADKFLKTHSAEINKFWKRTAYPNDPNSSVSDTLNWLKKAIKSADFPLFCAVAGELDDLKLIRFSADSSILNSKKPSKFRY